jgi:hypothetical protein
MLPRWVAWAIGGVVVACAAGLALLVTLTGGSQGGSTPTLHPDAAVLTAYTSALRGPTSEGGQIVEEEMKPSISEFNQGQVDAATFVQRARGWEVGLRRVKAQIDRLPVPPAIAAAGPLFDRALDGYINAAQLFQQAGTVPQAQRAAAVDRAVAAAEAADHQYDQAALLVQRALAAAGLQPDSALPNPTPAASPT